MSRFWETQEFKRQKKKWDKKLVQSGFQDQENSKEQLKQQDLRTLAFLNRRRLIQFFDSLRDYLHEHPEIPKKYRLVLELYCEGTRIQGRGGIIEQTGYCDKSVRNIIQKYKKILLYRI